MTIQLWSHVPVMSAPSAAEVIITTLVVPNVNVNEAIALCCSMFIDNPDGDAGGAVVRIRRTNLAGAIVATCGDTGINGTNAGDAPVLTGPFFDGPGLVGSVVYVLTVAMTDATGPSIGISATLGAGYN